MGWNGSTICRPPLMGKRFGTPTSNCCGMMALFIGVPTASSMAKMSSRLMSLLAAWMAFGNW